MLVSAILTEGALLSCLSKHNQSLAKAEQALALLKKLADQSWQEEVVRRRAAGEPVPAEPDVVYYGPMLAMCYNNIAVELELLHHHEACLSACQVRPRITTGMCRAARQHHLLPPDILRQPSIHPLLR